MIAEALRSIHARLGLRYVVSQMRIASAGRGYVIDEQSLARLREELAREKASE